MRSLHWRVVMLVAVMAAVAPVFGQEQAPGAAAAPTSFWTQETLTNDWFGAGQVLRRHGISLAASTTYFYQGLAAGDGNQTFKSGGKGEVFLNLDGGKLGLWEGFGLTAYGEYNVGQTPIFFGGTLLPNNIALSFPGYNKTVGDISLYLSQRFGEHVNLMFGKFNMILFNDFGKEFMGGRGVEQFMHLEFTAPASGIVPPTIFGGIGYVEVNPIKFTLMVYDPSSAIRKTGFENPFEKGVTMYGTLEGKFTIFERLSKHSVSLAYSTQNGIDLADLPYLSLPTESKDTLDRKENRYYISYAFEQTLWRSASNPKKAWGLFGQVGKSDGNPNPLGWYALAGFGGSIPFEVRQNDKFGVGFFYKGLSSTLKDSLKPLLRDEYGMEVFYNLALTPWLRLTGDAQVIRPVLTNRDTAVFLGLRTQVVF